MPANIRKAYDTSTVFYASGGLAAPKPPAQYYFMAKKRKKKRPTFIKDWRKHRHLTQEQLGERLGLAQATVARIERGEINYTQPVLEALADALNCDPWVLIWRPPGAQDKLRDVLAELDPDTQKRALTVIQALKDSEAA